MMRRLAVPIQTQLNRIGVPSALVRRTFQPSVNIIERRAEVALQRLLMTRLSLLLILHPKVNPAPPQIPGIRGHLFRIVAERFGIPRQRVRSADVIVIPGELDGAPSVKDLGRLDLPRQLAALRHLSNRLAHASLGGFEPRLTIRIVRRILVHHRRRARVRLPVVHVVIARLAVHLAVHLLPIPARQILSGGLEVVGLVRRIPEKRRDLRADVSFRAHGRELLGMVDVVIVDRIAQPLVRVRIRGIGRQYHEHVARQHVARTRHVRIQQLRHGQSARRRRGLLRLARVPAPAQVGIVARPEALPLGALFALVVPHRHQGVLVGNAYLGIASFSAAGTGAIFVVFVAGIAWLGRVPAPAFFFEVAGPVGLAFGAVVAVGVGDCAADAFLAEGSVAVAAGFFAGEFFEGALLGFV